MASTKFKDTADRKWNLKLSVPAIKRFQDELDINLGTDMHRVQDLAGDPVKFAAGLVAILRPQIEEAGITEEEFYEALDGSTLHAAAEAYVEACLQFMPAARAKVFRASYERLMEAQDRACDEMLDKIENADFDAILRDTETKPAPTTAV